MFRKYVYHDITWYDFKNPQLEEFLDVARGYSFDKELIKKFLTKQERPEATIEGDVIFLSLFFPCDLDKDNETILSKEVRFIIGKDFIFTGRNADIRGFYDLKRKIKDRKTNSLDSTNPNATGPLTELLREVYIHIGNDLEELQNSLRYIERRITRSKDVPKKVVYKTNKKALRLHTLLKQQEDVWIAFDALCREFFSDLHTNESLDIIMKDYQKAITKSDEVTSKEIDQKLLFKRALQRKQRIVKLQKIAFWTVFVALAVVGFKVL